MFKSWHNFKIKRLNGDIIDLYEAGLTVLGFNSPTPEPDIYEEEIESIDGTTDLGARLPGRTAKARFYIESHDYIAHSLMIDKVYKIFDSREQFYIIRDAQPGKQLLVRRANGFAPSTDPSFTGEFEIDFKSHSPYWESVGDTTDLIDFSSDKWAIGMGLTTDGEYNYKKPVSELANFSVENPGDVPISLDSFHRPLEIIFNGDGSSDNLKVINFTTGQEWQYYGTTARHDRLHLEGVRTFKNFVSVLPDTNRKTLSFAPGTNDIIVEGVTSGTLQMQIISKFYYL